MAWVDCMRWRRAAAFVRGTGWALAAVIFCSSAAATFASEGPDALAGFAISSAVSLTILAVAHLVGRVLDRRGERLVTR